MSAPSLRHASSFSADPAVTATVAPKCLPSWIAIVPIPLDPPCTRNVSPAASRAAMKTLEYTVQTTSGSAAASVRDRDEGTGSSCPAGAATSDAYPPPESSAQTRSPTARPLPPGPTATTLPQHSTPGHGAQPGARPHN